MKKWFFLIAIAILAIVLPLSLLYKGFKENEVVNAEQAVSVARSNIQFSTIESVDYYAGDNGYHVIIGKNSDGEEIIVWVQEDNIWEHSLSEAVSREKIVAQLSNANIKRLVPGMMTTDDGEKLPIWEAYYTIEEQSFYEYFDFFTGERIQKITL